MGNYNGRVVLRVVMITLALIPAQAFGQDFNGDAPPPAPAPFQAAEGRPEAVQALTRGAVHEAFAGPVVYDPKPGPIIANAPPQVIQELPPDQKPEGANVAWISGYWSWDDTRSDYIWISGVWRNIPPGRQWVPGYWHQVRNGVQWVPGTWMSVQTAQAQYLAAPPVNLESGPNSPTPAAGSIWAPGTWIWQDGQYFWRPGFWIAPQPNWVWVPAQYVWTPSGYIFTEGYWDRPIATRGQMFAPVYYAQPVYLQPNYIYQPSIGIVTSGLMVSLFVRPSCHAYYFGDYYATNYVGIGIYPWYSYHQSRYGYDPLYSYYSVTYAQSNPGWAVSIREEYVYRQNNIAARPPHTYREMERFTRNNNVTVNNITVNNVRNVSFAAPIQKIAENGGKNGGMRFQRIEAAEQRQHQAQAQEMRHFQQERAKSETVAMRNNRPGETFRPHTMELPKSPVAHVAPAHAAQVQNLVGQAQPERAAQPHHPTAQPHPAAQPHAIAPHHEPPARPLHPAADPNVPQLGQTHPNPRPDPHFEAAHPAAHSPHPAAHSPSPAAHSPHPAATPASRPATPHPSSARSEPRHSEKR